MLPTKDPSQYKRLTQTESEGLETNFPSKQTGKKKIRGSNTHIRQNRLPKKGHKERTRRSLHNIQRKNPPRRHKHCKYICTQHRSTQIHKILEGFKKDIDSNTIIVGDFNTPLSKKDRSSKQNINKDIVSLNNTLDELNLTDIYIESFSSQKSKIHILFKCPWNFFKDRPMIGNKASLNKFKKIEIISSIFSDNKGLKLETNPKGKNPKH